MDFYTNLTLKQYKALEEVMRKLEETVHTSVEGYYHKSIRIPVGDATFEFHGPAVKAAEPAVEPAVEKRVPMIHRPPAVAPAGPAAWLNRREGGPTDRRKDEWGDPEIGRRGRGVGRRKSDSEDNKKQEAGEHPVG